MNVEAQFSNGSLNADLCKALLDVLPYSNEFYDYRGDLMADPIPNLHKKYGGSPLLTSVVKEVTTRMLSHGSLRRYFTGMPTQQVLAINIELIALALGHTTSKYSPELPKLSYAELKLTQHAYEEVIKIIRHSLLDNGFESRDATIAINVLDMHAESLLNVPITRRVISPFSGVDRRRLSR